MSQHFSGRVPTTRAHSDSLELCSQIERRTREEAAELEAILKSYLKSGKHDNFRHYAELKYFASGATLLE